MLYPSNSIWENRSIFYINTEPYLIPIKLFKYLVQFINNQYPNIINQ